MDEDLWEMLEHFRIRKVLAEYCRGSDRADEPLMASIYAADSWDDHGVVRAPGPEYSKLMCQRVAETTETLSHLLGQSVITLDGDCAGAETYFLAVAHDTAPDGRRMCNQLGGRFVDQLVREDGAWRVKHRTAVRDWSVAIPVDHDWDLSHTLTAGQRSNDDRSYAVLGTSHGGAGGSAYHRKDCTRMIPALRNRNYVQLCWIVPDVEASIAHWIKSTGAGPFFVFDDLHFEDAQYRGQPADIQRCRAAIGQFGEMQIELVEPTDAGPGLWTELVPKGQLGFHHVGLYCHDYDAERAAYMADGSEMAFEGLMMGAKTCYIDTSPTLGFMTELITANPVAEMVFGEFKKASQGWNGNDPIRTLG